MSGSEPSDAIRVVNAVLTQLDQIKRYSTDLTFSHHLQQLCSVPVANIMDIIVHIVFFHDQK